MTVLMMHQDFKSDLTFYHDFLFFFTKLNKPRGPDLQTSS